MFVGYFVDLRVIDMSFGFCACWIILLTCVLMCVVVPNVIACMFVYLLLILIVMHFVIDLCFHLKAKDLSRTKCHKEMKDT